ncbi:MAG: hypothetical protein H7Y32_13000, partial [Chloroflexales bacterium]|nr:hypothetical protein [Chloroflexales bacterium]
QPQRASGNRAAHRRLARWLRVEVAGTRYPWQLHILKNGFFHKLVEETAPGESSSVELDDDAAPGTYYRAELHAIPSYSDFPYQKWRNWDSLLAFTNPVFVA